MTGLEQEYKDKLIISIVTTSWYAPSDQIQSAAAFFEESGFGVRIKTRGLDTKEERDKYDIASVFQKIKGEYFKSRPTSTDEEREATQKDFEKDYLDYSAAFKKMKKKDGSSTNVEDERLQRLGNNEFVPLKDYLEDTYKKSQILKEEVEAASRGEVDVIWPVDGGSGAPEMLSFLPDKLPENPAIIVGMSDVGHVQNALIHSTNHSMKGIQEFGSRVFGDRLFTDRNRGRINELFSTIQKTRNGEEVDAEYTLKAGEKNKTPTKPQLVNMSGGTLNVINRAGDYDLPLSNDKNSDTVIVEMHGQAKKLAGDVSQRAEDREQDSFDKIFGNKKNIILGNVLFDKKSDEFQRFTDRASDEGINVYEGLPFGHGGTQYQRRPIPLNVASVLLPGSSETEATLLINPSKEKLQEKLEEIGYKYTPAKFVETLRDSPEQAREFIMSETEMAAVMIKYSGLQPKDIFDQVGVDESVQKQITDKISQGIGEPRDKKISSPQIQFPDRIIREVKESDLKMQEQLQLGKENLKQVPEELMSMSEKHQRELLEISKLLKGEGAKPSYDDNGTEVQSKAKSETKRREHNTPQSGINL